MALPDDEFSPAARRGPPAAPSSAGSTFLLRWLALAVAMALGVTAVWLSWQLEAVRTENTALRTERDLARVSSLALENQLAERTLLAERMINDLGRELREHSDLTQLKVMVLHPPAENNDESLAVVVWNQQDQAGLLAVEQMPPNNDAQDYQIWIADPAQSEPVNGGLFHLRPGEKKTVAFKPDRSITVATGFAVSREKKGGAPKSEGPTVLLGR
jgi:hypothetical protein